MQVEISEREAQIALDIIARGCAHLGSELAQRGAEIAGPAMAILAVAEQLKMRLNIVIQEAAAKTEAPAKPKKPGKPDKPEAPATPPATKPKG